MVIEAVADRRGGNIVMLDLRPVSLIADYFVICSGNNERHLRAIIEEIEARGAENGIGSPRMEGAPESGWVIMDYGSVVVHIFILVMRSHYDLEKLWKDAPLVVTVR